MPHNIHPDIVTPPDTTVLWRYMDFVKFVHLLETRLLWFSRADQFEDPKEGTFTDAERNHFRSQAPPPGLGGRSILEAFQESTRMMRASTYVSCWYGGHGESLAMWDVYGKTCGVVAVKSTVGLLKGMLSDFDGVAYIAPVRYVNWNESPWDNNALVMCARKDLAYEYESEVRILLWEFPMANHPFFAPLTKMCKPWDLRDRGDPPQGVGLPVDLDALITEVVVGPREQPWFTGLMKKVMKTYSIAAELTVSTQLTPRS